MKVCAISDLHGHLPGYEPSKFEFALQVETYGNWGSMPFEIEPCDLLLIAGDICPVTNHSVDRQAAFLDGPFREWLTRVPANRVIGIAGNHDWIFQRDPGMVPGGLNWSYLEDTRWCPPWPGVPMVHGSPHQPPFCDWAFNLPETELAKKWAMIPGNTDILVLHGPPAGWGDQPIDGRPTGSPSLRDRILQIKPKLTVFGHIHEAYGRWEEPWGTLANVSIRNRDYQVVNPPQYFEI